MGKCSVQVATGLPIGLDVCSYFVLEGTNLMVPCSFDDSQFGASAGASQKRRPKVAIDLFVSIFSVLHC